MPVHYLLIVDAPHYCAGAVWRKEGKTWACVDAAPILGWTRGKDVQEVGDYLKRKGFKWQWIREDSKK
jgi:hypothetical protein